jgi:hypothetical protein
MISPGMEEVPQRNELRGEAQTQVASLLEVLDEDIRHLETTLSRLDTLRTLLVKREDAALKALLDDIGQQAEAYRVNEQKRQQIRKRLAADLGCKEGDLTLSRLQGALAGQTRAAVADRQARLRVLAAQLKREYTLTVLLIRDCTRFNRSLLRVFLASGGRGAAAYGPSGAARRQGGATLMSMQL